MPRSGTGAVLVGPASVDRYLATGERLPGGGALNMAYHWARRAFPFTLVSRVATGDAALFEPFLDRHRIERTESFVVDGESCSVDVVFGDDRQPWMNNFVEGVWSDFEFSDDEVEMIVLGTPTHLVLVDVVDRALHDLVRRAVLGRARLTADFLSLRHFTPERFARTFELLDIGFVGWPGVPEDALVEELGAHAGQFGNVLVVTFGSRGVSVFDGRSGAVERHWFEVAARVVSGTTVGCGDAFIAAFLSEWWSSATIADAVEAGMALGADATAWPAALPATAYR